MAWIAPEVSRALTMNEMENNALMVGRYFLKKKWTPNAIAGMLGNMQSESTINPARWEDDTPDTGGYGLVQWTPYTNYSDWAGSGWERNGNKECERIQWELENNKQWIATSTYNFSFEEYSRMRESPTYMADAFLKNYERPENQDQPIRGVQAEYWYKYIIQHLLSRIWYWYAYKEQERRFKK